jgi:hypothetical protein
MAPGDSMICESPEETMQSGQSTPPLRPEKIIGLFDAPPQDRQWSSFGW